MSGALNDYRRLWTVATAWGSARFAGWACRVTLLLALAAGMARLAGLLERSLFWRAELLFAVLWLVLMWGLLFIPVSILMNSASNARLVPRLRRRLLQVAVGGWLLLSVAVTLLTGSWAFLPLVAAAVLGMMLVSGGMRWAFLPVWLLLFGPLLFRNALPVSVVRAVTSPPGMLAGSLALLLWAVWSFSVLYPAGGDRHLDGRAQRVAGIKRFQSKETGMPYVAAWTSRFGYIPSLLRDCWERRPDAMLMHALGPAAHWSAWLAIPATVLAAGLALCLYPAVSGHPIPRPATDWLLGFSMASMNMMILFVTPAFGQQLRKTRGEQALLRLTPLAGDSALLNRRLAAGVLKGALANWGLLSASLLLLAWLIGGNGDMLLRDFALSCLSGQLAVADLLPGFARGAPSFRPQRLAGLALLGACNGALAYGLSLLGGSVWLWLMAIGVLGCALLLAWGWRSMLAAPPVFPAGPME